jgi:hypothetical protein
VEGEDMEELHLCLNKVFSRPFLTPKLVLDQTTKERLPRLKSLALWMGRRRSFGQRIELKPIQIIKLFFNKSKRSLANEKINNQINEGNFYENAFLKYWKAFENYDFHHLSFS